MPEPLSVPRSLVRRSGTRDDVLRASRVRGGCARANGRPFPNLFGRGHGGQPACASSRARSLPHGYPRLWRLHSVCMEPASHVARGDATDASLRCSFHAR